jgi:miniconductance mechanosensitive channel
MIELLSTWFYSIDWSGKLYTAGYAAVRLFIALAVSFIIGKGAGILVSSIVRRFVEHNIFSFNKSLIRKDFYKRLIMMFPFFVLYFTAEFIFHDVLKFALFIDRVLFSVLALLGIYTLSAFIDALDHYYQEFEVSRKNPIKGYLQLVKIFLTISILIVIISTLLNKSPWGFLSGFGAMTALVILVFKDWILGLIASIQISANNLVVIGDSIEMEKYGINGEVIEISLSTVKVKNWDNTISMVPAYSLISETFKNMHGIKESGGRRIKRVLYIDINSIALPDEKILKRLQRLNLLKGTDELKELARSIKAGRDERINKGGVTNIGIFRKYVELYLMNYIGIDNEKKLMAKLLEPTANGLPLQIYVFTSIIDIVEYELAVAGIFEHLIAVIPEFGLKLFQNPSGGDMRKLT